MKTQQTKTTDIEPIEIDCTFKYRCSCGIDHWVYLREASSDGFFIVCYCNNKLYPKIVRSIDIKYDQIESISIENECTTKNIVDIDKEISSDIITRCSLAMQGLGFTSKESKERLIKVYDESTYSDDKNLIKLALLEK